MMSERVREFLGVWAPLIVGLLLMATAVRFLLEPVPPTGGPPGRSLPAGYEATWHLCGLGLLAVGGLLLLSTLGRYRKARQAARDSEKPGDALK